LAASVHSFLKMESYVMLNKPATKVILKIAACLALAVGAYFFATGLMDSLFAYRSPLKDNPPAAGQPLGTAQTRRVVFVLVDALREDTSRKETVMPFLAELRKQGAWAMMHSRPPSYSEPGYTSLLTGAWPDLHDGPPINLDYEEIPTFTQDDLFSAASRAGLKTAVSGYYWFEKLIPQEAVSASFYTAGEDKAADREVVDAALTWLKDPSYQLVLIHLDQVDYAGHHEGGAQDPNWDAAAKRSDDLIREITAKMDFSQDTLVILSDHGQIDLGGHGGQDAITLVEPFILVGAGVKPGKYAEIQMVDVAPTLAALLGASIPGTSQGHVRTEMLAFTAEQVQAIQAALQEQQAGLLAAFQAATGKKLPAVEDLDDPVAAHQAALEQAYSFSGLLGERLPRAVISLIILAVIAAAFYRMRGHLWIWMVGCALLYILLFNLRYAILDRRTYSLSSVLSANELILYAAVTALIALLVGWLVFTLGTQTFQQKPGGAANRVLDWTLVTLALMALPVLWSYTLNGMYVTWRLPGFLSMFLGFLSLLQILIIGALGPLLAGVTALIARLRAR
jgi:hypothetical protein